mmetsp:Transcript_5383/g.15931  ORF Transcript_5383/g.15931 Transcript_5383/m.15931 type:complete len:431 (-) Transcript_5383:174-1466(-)|eukprot:CAMPEP_0119259380 /NCGR_PEP_ID=MMETSP1329-20130426/217_1 /TAXON_ID=114041 /ORGANISM="Genus nov. species nov., Strain RCC1024" /LENGTH=430 /DNA_ID=CAMNT_0007258759 /DNA_START=120 /DNA_END=1412 /DNA_ORIENTATION=+
MEAERKSGRRATLTAEQRKNEKKKAPTRTTERKKSPPSTAPFKHSRIGPHFQVDKELLSLLPKTVYPRDVKYNCEWPKAVSSVQPELVPAISRVACNSDVKYTSWQLESLPSLKTSALVTIKLKAGKTAIGRTRETPIPDSRVSRLHCEVIVDECNEVWISPLYELGNVITVNNRVCIRADGWRQLKRGDILCLWRDEISFRLGLRELAHALPAEQCAHPLEATAERVWAPPPVGSPAAAACKAVLDAGEPGAEEAMLFELHAADFAAEADGRVKLASGKIGGTSAIGIRWTTPLVACFSSSLFRHRKVFRFVSLELCVPVADVLNYYYAVFKTRCPASYSKVKSAMKRAAKERRHKEGQLPLWGNQLTDSPTIDDGNADHCDACKAGGELLCCETCEKAFHLACVHLGKVPDGDWFCATCIAMGRAPRK